MIGVHVAINYLDIVLCLVAVVFIFEIEWVVPLKLGEVYTKMQLRSTLDSFCHCTCIIKHKCLNIALYDLHINIVHNYIQAKKLTNNVNVRSIVD